MINLKCSQCGSSLPVDPDTLNSRVYVCPKCAFPLEAPSDLTELLGLSAKPGNGPAPVKQRPPVPADQDVTLAPDRPITPFPLGPRSSTPSKLELNKKKPAGPSKGKSVAPDKLSNARTRWLILGGAGAGVVGVAAAVILLVAGGGGNNPLPPGGDNNKEVQGKGPGGPDKQLPKNTTPTAVTLAKELSNPNAKARLDAAAALGNLGPAGRDAFPVLIGALKDPDVKVRQASLEALTKIGPPNKDDLPLISATLRQETEESRVYAAGALASLGQDAQGEMIFLRVLSADPNQRVSEEARKALRSIEMVVLGSWKVALKASDPDVRRDAAQALGDLGPDARSAIPNLVDALADKNSAVRVAAADALVQIGPESSKVLQETLKDSNATVRHAAIAALGRLGPDARDSVPLLVGLASTEKKYRQDAVDALAKIGTFAIPTLVKALEKEKTPVRQQVLADALVMIGGEALPALAMIKKDDKKDVAAMVVKKIEAQPKPVLPKVKELSGNAGLVMAELRAYFSACDTNKDGYIDKAEMAKMARGAGAKPYDWTPDPNKTKVMTPKDFQKYPDYAFINRVDRDEDGKISRHEFNLWAYDYAKYTAEAMEIQDRIKKAEIRLGEKKMSAAIRAQLHNQITADWAAYRLVQRGNHYAHHMEWMQREVMRRLPGHRWHP